MRCSSMCVNCEPGNTECNENSYTECAQTLCMQDTLGAGFSFDTAANFYYTVYCHDYEVS